MLPFLKIAPLPKLTQQAFLHIRGLRIACPLGYSFSYPFAYPSYPSYPRYLLRVKPKKYSGLPFFPTPSGLTQKYQGKKFKPQKAQAKNGCLSSFLPRLFALNILIFFLCLPCVGCGSILPLTPVDVVPTVAHVGYATVQDQREMKDIISDKDLALRLKQELMRVRVKDGYFLNVHVFNGQVFLVGDPPQDFQEAAVRFTMQQEGVVSLDYCFFPHNSGNAFNDFLVSASLRSNLVFEERISSTWVETEIYASTAILLGVVPDNDAIEHIKAVAWNTQGVNNVISFLLLDDSS